VKGHPTLHPSINGKVFIRQCTVCPEDLDPERKEALLMINTVQDDPDACTMFHIIKLYRGTCIVLALK
jgi:hypothetical protein